MGYTHYWKFDENAIKLNGQLINYDVDKDNKELIVLNGDTWNEFIEVIKPILDEGISKGIINVGLGEDSLKLDSEMVWFNGVGVNSHETFYLHRISKKSKHQWDNEIPLGFSFCKTARKPYDEYVVRVLIEYERFFGDVVLISSDGDWDEVKKKYVLKDITPNVAIAILEELNQGVLDVISGIDKGYEWDKSGDFFSNYITTSYLDNPSVWDGGLGKGLKYYKFPDTIGPKSLIEDNLDEEGFSSYEINASPNEGYYEVIIGVTKDELEELGKLRYEWGFDEDDISFYEIDPKTKRYKEV